LILAGGYRRAERARNQINAMGGCLEVMGRIDNRWKYKALGGLAQQHISYKTKD